MEESRERASSEKVDLVAMKNDGREQRVHNLGLTCDAAMLPSRDPKDSYNCWLGESRGVEGVARRSELP